MVELKEVTKKQKALVGAYLMEHVKTGKVYIGSTSDLSRRSQSHLSALRAGKHYNRKLQELYNQDPEFKFFFAIAEDRDMAYDFEQELIDHHWFSGNILNLSRDAREAFRVLSDESRERIRQAVLGTKRSEETKELLRQSKLGKPRPQHVREMLQTMNIGRKASPELKEKFSLMRKGKKMPPRSAEHIEKLRQARIGKPSRKLTPEECLAISLRLKGKKHSPEHVENNRRAQLARNYRHSEEVRKQISQANKGKKMPETTLKAISKPVVVKGIEYPSLSEAARQLGIKRPTLEYKLRNNFVERRKSNIPVPG